jgi:opacity protein-like surface antigen
MNRWLVVLCALLAVAFPAQAEMYVAGQIGANLPQDISNVEWSAGSFRAPGSDIALQTSLMYGAKLGYYFDQLPWLGVETEVYNSNPHIKQQDVRIGNTNLGSIPGAHHRMLTWSPVTVVGRLQFGGLEPYAGVGLGLFFSRISDESGSNSDTAVGLNTQLGLRYRITPHVAVFGEWKYNRASLNHDLGGGVKFEGDYSAHILAFGVGYHF